MQVPGNASRLQRRDVQIGAGGAVSLAFGAGTFGSFGIHGLLSRDEGIYVYAAQRLSHGVAPYKSIFDPKTPLASFIGGIAASLAHAVGSNDIYAIRAAFFLCSLLTVVAVYALVLQLYRSVIGATVAAVVFACFNGFAKDALSGPDAKTPGILCAVLAMLFLARKSWTWAAGFGALAFLAWQPLVIYPLLAVGLAAVFSEPGRRRMATVWAAAAAAGPVVATLIYFAAAGALRDFWQSTVAYPFTGVVEKPVPFLDRFTRITDVVGKEYRFSGWLLYAGLIALVVISVRRMHALRAQRWRMIADPWIAAVLITFAFEGLYAIYDFQGYPDVFPLLPYAAVGLGALAALVMQRVSQQETRPELRPRVAVAIFALLILVAGLSVAYFKPDVKDGVALRAQQADACAVQRLLQPDGKLYALGDPVFLALTHRAVATRYIYLEAGVDKWKVDHTQGGFDAWVAAILRIHPDVIGDGGWYKHLHSRMDNALKAAGYLKRFDGSWHLFVTPEVLARAPSAGVQLTQFKTKFATGPQGHELPASGC